MRTIRVAGLVAVTALLVGGARPAGAQLASAELFVNVTAGASATDMNLPTDTESFSDGPRTTDIFLGSGTIPFDLQAISGGGRADADGQINYLATTSSQISASGNFVFMASAAAPAAALAGFDAVFKITFTVAATTPYTLTGHVSTGRALSAPEVVACQVNGTVLAGDSRATPLAPGTYPFLAERVASAGEPIFIECDAASSGGTSDVNTVTWEFTANFGPITPTTSTTLVPLTRRQCRKACRQAKAACRTACPTDKAEGRACRRSCKRRGRACGQSSGCTLPAG